MKITMKKIEDILNSKRLPRVTPESFRDLRKRPSVKKTRLVLDNEYFERGYASLFPSSATLVYCILGKFAHHENQTCYPSAEEIMRLSGIKNRQTIFNAIKILEGANIIFIHRSNGRISNLYLLLDVPVWKSLNSIKIETILAQKRGQVTVSKPEGQPYQSNVINSGTDDTRNHIKNLSNEIITGNSEKEESENANPLGRLGGGAKSVLYDHYNESDIAEAVKEIPEDGKKLSTKDVMEVLRRHGAVLTKELPLYLRGASP